MYDATTAIRAARNDVWVIAHLSETTQPASQVPTRLSDQGVANAQDDLDIREVVVGQRPEGVNNLQYGFVESAAELERRAAPQPA